MKRITCGCLSVIVVLALALAGQPGSVIFRQERDETMEENTQDAQDTKLEQMKRKAAGSLGDASQLAKLSDDAQAHALVSIAASLVAITELLDDVVATQMRQERTVGATNETLENQGGYITDALRRIASSLP